MVSPWLRHTIGRGAKDGARAQQVARPATGVLLSYSRYPAGMQGKLRHAVGTSTGACSLAVPCSIRQPQKIQSIVFKNIFVWHKTRCAPTFFCTQVSAMKVSIERGHFEALLAEFPRLQPWAAQLRWQSGGDGVCRFARRRAGAAGGPLSGRRRHPARAGRRSCSPCNRRWRQAARALAKTSWTRWPRRWRII